MGRKRSSFVEKLQGYSTSRKVAAVLGVLVVALAFVVLVPALQPSSPESETVVSVNALPADPGASNQSEATPEGDAVADTQDQQPAETDGPSGAYVPGEMIVQFGQGASVDELNAALSELPSIAACEVTQSDVEAGYALLPVADGYSVEEAIAQAGSVDYVLSPQPNYIYTLAEEAQLGPDDFRAALVDMDAFFTQAIPDDPYGKQDAENNYNWHLEAIHAYDAWDKVKGESGNPKVTVAVMDSGYYVGHEDLGSVDDKTNPGNVITTYDATRSENYNSGMTDGQHHGTHVAGIIAATANNGKGVAGVSYNAQILPIQIFHQVPSNGKYEATTVSLKQAYTYVEENRERYNIRVVNLSAGAPQTSAAKDDVVLNAIESAYKEGVLTVMAACNETSASKVPYSAYPVSFADHALGVIALDKSGKRVSTSNYNPDNNMRMDISAPGENVYSTVDSGSASYGTKTGTSMATPIVSGVAALVFTANPALTPDDVMDIIRGTATDVGEKGFDRETGYGEVNALEAVESATMYLSGYSSLLKGGSTKLSVTGEPTGSGVSWESSDSDIAAVSQDGTVTGVAAGEARITATTAGRTLVKTITVYDISFSRAVYENGSLVDSPAIDSCELRADERLDLRFNENPDTGLWLIDTSDSNVISATVSGDNLVRVNATGSGEAYVTATLKENTKLVVRVKVSVIGSANKGDLASDRGSVTWPFLNSKGQQSTVYYYTGSAIAPVPSKVTYSTKVGDSYDAGTPLKLNTDYTVSYKNNTNAGTATATVNGKGSYTGSVSQNFTISRTPLTHAKVSATCAAVTYTGKAQTPVPTLKLSINGTYTLRQNVDFKVTSYSNNVNAGTGRVTVTGIGNFTGTRTVDFTIQPKVPTVSGATRVPVGATAAYTVSDSGSIAIKSGSDCATLSGKTLRGKKAGTVVLSVRDSRGVERSTKSVTVYALSGAFAVQSGINSSYVLDISGASLVNGGNAQLYRSNGTGAQRFTFALQSDGYYRISCAKNGKALDVSGASKNNSANVQQYGWNGTAAQRWAISVDASNRVTFTCKCSGKVLDVSGGVASNGRNVQQYTSNGTAAQKWTLQAASYSTGPVLDGEYRIASAINGGYALDVSGASRSYGANVQIWSSNGTAAQRWRVEHMGGGYYRLTCAASGLALDVSGASKSNSANVQQWGWNGTAAQLWKITRNSDGTYSLTCKCSGKVLDVSGGVASSGRNVWQYGWNSTFAQRWRLYQY